MLERSCNDVTPRTVRSRTKRAKELVQPLSGPSSEAVAMQTSHMIKSFDTKQREQILKNFNHTVSVPQDAVASMKSLLGMEFNQGHSQMA